MLNNGVTTGCYIIMTDATNTGKCLDKGKRKRKGPKNEAKENVKDPSTGSKNDNVSESFTNIEIERKCEVEINSSVPVDSTEGSPPKRKVSRLLRLRTFSQRTLNRLRHATRTFRRLLARLFNFRFHRRCHSDMDLFHSVNFTAARIGELYGRPYRNQHLSLSTTAPCPRNAHVTRSEPSIPSCSSTLDRNSNFEFDARPAIFASTSDISSSSSHL